MTSSDLIGRLAARFPRLVYVDAELTVLAILDSISTQLAKGDRVQIRGFGTFSVHVRPPKRGRNPKSGARVDVPAKAVPHFKAGKELRVRVDHRE